MPDDSLLVARLYEQIRDGRRFQAVRFGCFRDTWRAPDEGTEIIANGDVGAYLNPNSTEVFEPAGNGHTTDLATHWSRRRVVDRPDLRPFLPGLDGEL